MADNVQITAGSGTTVATDEITGVHYQLVKPAFGALDTATLVTASVGLPTNVVQLGGSTPSATNPLPVRLTDGASYLGAGTEYTEGDTDTTISGSAILFEADTTTSTLRAVSATYPLPVSDAGGSLTVDGTVAVSGSVAVTGTFWQATQPVSGTVAATQSGTWTVQPGNTANTTAWLVTGTGGTFPATQSGTWNVGTVTTVTTVSTVTNVSQLGGQAVAMGTGTRSTGTQRVTIATDDVVPASQSGTWTVQPGNTANTTPWLVAPQPTTAGGLSAYSFLSTAAVQAAAIKASAGQVYALQFFNTNAAARFVRLYNQTTTPATTDAANILWRGIVPGNTAGTGFVVDFPAGLAFGTGIGIRVTAAIADNDATALGANEVIGGVQYR